MRFLFVMDPPSTVNVELDTSFALMLAAQTLRHTVDHCLITDLGLEGGRAFATSRPATMARDAANAITLGDRFVTQLARYDAVFVRTDPPFDSNYLWGTQVLERAKSETLVINDPRGLRDANEKLYACHFPELMPETLVSNDARTITEFVTRVGGRAVIKPLGGAGGDGVMMLSIGDLNFRAIMEATTYSGRRLAMIQAFVPEVRTGDKRILLIDGEPLGAILRVPRADDMRSNIHVGGTVEPATLDAADKKIVETLAPRLRADGLYFVGLDVIGGKLTEVNVTSPTGIQQMSRHAGKDLAVNVIEWCCARAGSRSTS